MTTWQWIGLLITATIHTIALVRWGSKMDFSISKLTTMVERHERWIESYEEKKQERLEMEIHELREQLSASKVVQP